MGRGNRPNYSLSASRIKTFVSCPKKYELKYIDRRDTTKPKNGYATAGLLVHESIEHFLENHPDEKNRSRIESILKQQFFHLEENKFKEDVEKYVSDKQRSDALKCVDTAAKYLSKVEFTLRGIEAGAVFHINHDRVDETAIGYMDVTTESEIWDWKTGRIRGEDTARDERIQGSIYMGAYQYLYDEMPDAIKFIYLKEGKVRELDPSHDNWQSMVNHAAELVEARAVGDFPAKPGDQCYWCDYENFCPASNTSPGQINEAMADGQPYLWNAI